MARYHARRTKAHTMTSPQCKQTFVVELATDGDVTVDEVQGLLVAGGYHVVEVGQPVMRSVDNPKAFYCPTCETCHEPPFHG
jgi:hypothetical protein